MFLVALSESQKKEPFWKCKAYPSLIPSHIDSENVGAVLQGLTAARNSKFSCGERGKLWAEFPSRYSAPVSCTVIPLSVVGETICSVTSSSLKLGWLLVAHGQFYHCWCSCCAVYCFEAREQDIYFVLRRHCTCATIISSGIPEYLDLYTFTSTLMYLYEYLEVTYFDTFSTSRCLHS